MRVYQALDRLFPKSFTAKIFCITFVGTHVPLIVMVIWALSGAASIRETLPVLIPILIATLVGTGAALVALREVLQPLYLVQKALCDYDTRNALAPLPDGHKDEVGALMRHTNQVLNSVQDRLVTAEQAAQTDPLTQLLNRRGFEQVTGRMGAGAVLLVDIDHFKSVNDTLGHDAGDRVLQQVAGILRDTTRRSDVVARYGGEEFVIFMRDATIREAGFLGERLRVGVERGSKTLGQAITISVGAAVTGSERELKDLLLRADEATYQAKKDGRNRVVIREFAA